MMPVQRNSLCNQLAGKLPRADVAAMIQAVLENPAQTIHHKYSFVNGDLPIQQAIEQAD